MVEFLITPQKGQNEECPRGHRFIFRTQKAFPLKSNDFRFSHTESLRGAVDSSASYGDHCRRPGKLRFRGSQVTCSIVQLVDGGAPLPAPILSPTARCSPLPRQQQPQLRSSEVCSLNLSVPENMNLFPPFSLGNSHTAQSPGVESLHRNCHMTHDGGQTDLSVLPKVPQLVQGGATGCLIQSVQLIAEFFHCQLRSPSREKFSSSECFQQVPLGDGNWFPLSTSLYFYILLQSYFIFIQKSI